MTIIVKRLWIDRAGNSLVEFAIVAPLLIFLFLGMVDSAQAIARKHQLEQAAQRAVERATAYGTAGADFSGVKEDAASAAAVDPSQVTIQTWLECDGQRKQNFNEVCLEDQQIGRFISVSIKGFYEPLFAYGPFGRALGADGSGVFTLETDASVRIQ